MGIDFQEDKGGIDFQEEPSKLNPIETYAHSLAPNGLTAAIYGAKEALPDIPWTSPISGDWDKPLNTYRANRDQTREFLDNSQATNPKAALAGNMTRALSVPGSIPGQTLAAAGESALNSRADATRLYDPKERERLGQDVGIGTATGLAFSTAGKYLNRGVAPVKKVAEPVVEKAAILTPEDSVSHLMNLKNAPTQIATPPVAEPLQVAAESNVSKILDNISKRNPIGKYGKIGGALGTIGGPVGIAKGVAAGSVIDKGIPYVKSAAGAMQRGLQKAAGSKYGQSLSAAAQRGDGSYAITYFLKQQTDPEFRKLMEDDGNQ